MNRNSQRRAEKADDMRAIRTAMMQLGIDSNKQKYTIAELESISEESGRMMTDVMIYIRYGTL